MAKASLKPTRPTAGTNAGPSDETVLLAAYRRAIEADDQRD